MKIRIKETVTQPMQWQKHTK